MMKKSNSWAQVQEVRSKGLTAKLWGQNCQKSLKDEIVKKCGADGPKREARGHICKRNGKRQGPARKSSKKFELFLDLCVSSLCRGHANFLCIIPILSYVSEKTAWC